MELMDVRQLMADGWSRERIRREVQSGELERIRRGMYLLGPSADTIARHHQALDATSRALSGQWWFSHQSAAVLHQLPVARDSLERVSVTRNRRTGNSTTSDLKQWCAAITPEEGTTVGIHPATSVPRTLADLARNGDPAWAVAAADAALRRALATPEELREIVDAQPRRRGNRAARELLGFADGLAESPGESISRFNMMMAGIPAPVLQQEFVLRNGSRVRTDFWWPQFRLVGEFDGAMKYTDDLIPWRQPGDALLAEKAREDGLREIGLFVVRWGWRAATSRGLLGSIIRGAMTTASAAA